MMKLSSFGFIYLLMYSMFVLTLLFSKKIKCTTFFLRIVLNRINTYYVFLFPFIIGFSCTLWYCILWSLCIKNIKFLNRKPAFSVFQFIKLLLPYSLLSIVFTSLLLPVRTGVTLTYQFLFSHYYHICNHSTTCYSNDYFL